MAKANVWDPTADATVMPFNAKHFLQIIEWDRTILETIVESAKLRSDAVDYDLISKTVQMRSIASFGGADAKVKGFQIRLRPLAFGAAWKILDVMAELCLSVGNTDPWKPIERKVADMQQLIPQPGVPVPSDVWEATWAVYAATKEMRHSLVHREVSTTPSGDLQGKNKQGQQLPPLTATEQAAFIRAVKRLVDIVSDGQQTDRAVADLRAQYELLRAHHQVPIPPTSSVEHGPYRVRIDFPSDATLDVPSYLKLLAQKFPSQRYFDLEMQVDEKTLVVKLDEAPNEIVSLDPKAPPAWAFWD